MVQGMDNSPPRTKAAKTVLQTLQAAYMLLGALKEEACLLGNPTSVSHLNPSAGLIASGCVSINLLDIFGPGLWYKDD